MDTQYEYYIIHRFMLDKLELKGAELNIYAIIYGYSRQGNGAYFGSRRHLASLTGLTIRAVQYALDKLVKDKFLFKRKVNDLVMYECNLTKIDSNTALTSAKISLGSENISLDKCKNFTQVNYNENKFKDNKKINIYDYMNIGLKTNEKSNMFMNDLNTKFVIIDKQIYLLARQLAYINCDKYMQLELDRQIKFFNLQNNTDYIETCNIEYIPDLKETTIYSFMNGARWDYETKEQCTLAVQ